MENAEWAFASKDAAHQALLCQVEIEKLVNVASLVGDMHEWSSNKVMLMPAVTGRAFPIIKRALETLRPEISETVRTLPLHLIWRAYWKAAQEHGEDSVNLFEVLGELEQNPPEEIEVRT